MKSIFTFLFVFFNLMLWAQVPIDYVARYDFIGGSLENLATSGYSGNLTGSTIPSNLFRSDRFGRVDDAIRVNGNRLNGHILTGTNNELSVSFWILGGAPTSADQRIFQIIDSSGDGMTMRIGAGNKLTARFKNSGRDHLGFQSSNPVFDGDWHHIVFTIKKTSSGYDNSVFIDGVLNSVISQNLKSTDTSNFLTSNSQFIIGAVRYYNQLDDIQIFTRELSVQEVNQIYNYTPPASYTRAYVDANATGNNDGSSWNNAFVDLNHALNYSRNNLSEVWIAKGTYNPIGSAKASFHIRTDQLKIYGGFLGTETTLAARNLNNPPTILSGDINGDDTDVEFNFFGRQENVFNVARVNANDVLLDGMEINDGHAVNSAEFPYGAGLFIGDDANGLIIKNCAFNRNVALQGGAVRGFLNFNGSLNIENTIFNNNLSLYGSGLYILVNNFRTVNVNISNSLFTNNISKDFSSRDFGFTGSAAWIRANGNSSSVNTNIVNCTFAQNDDRGNILQNSPNNERGALGLSERTSGSSTHRATVSNCIFYNNTGNIKGTINKGHTARANITVFNSIDEFNFSNLGSTSAINSSNSDPLFTNPTANDFTLQTNSPAINAGDNSKILSGIISDLNGQRRVANSVVDMGAYEFQVSVTQRTLTINATNGTVSTSPNPFNGTYDYGTIVTLTAIPDAGYQFDGWSGGLSGTTNPATITMNSDKTVTAMFIPIPQRTLTTNATNGTISTNPNPVNGTYANGTVVTLSATPNPGYRFDGWSGDLTDTTSPSTITMNANKSVTAMFSIIPSYTLTVIGTNGSVSVTKPNNGNNYSEGTVVNFTATPDLGYQFDGWSGDLTGTTNPTSLTMNSNKTVTALFSADPKRLSLTSGNNGTISASPNSPDGFYPHGTVVTLTATPNAGYQFDGWDDDSSGTLNPTTITMNGNKRVTALFSLISHTLTVNAINGSVDLTKPNNGLNYTDGTVVSLTATPDLGYQFDGWSGDLTGTTNPASLTMNGNKTVTAMFSAIQRTLTIDATNGSVSTDPNPTNGTYDNGMVVTLTATPDAGYQFDGWSGGVTSTTNPVTLNMDGDKNVMAQFSTLTTSIYEVDDFEVKVFPNPFNDQIFISTKEDLKQIRIFNTLGLLVYEGTELTLDLTALPAGMYFLWIENSEGKEVQKQLVKE